MKKITSLLSTFSRITTILSIHPSLSPLPRSHEGVADSEAGRSVQHEADQTHVHSPRRPEEEHGDLHGDRETDHDQGQDHGTQRRHFHHEATLTW